MTDISIRQGTPADRDDIVEANLALAREIEHKIRDRKTVEAGVAAQLTEPEHGLYFLAEAGGQIIGQLALTWEWSDWSNGAFWWIQSVYIAPKYRGQGVFSQLYRHVANEARDRAGVAGLRLYVNKDNSAAMDVYRRVGMQTEDDDLLEVDFTSE